MEISFPNVKQLEIMKGVLESKPFSEVAKEAGVTVKDAVGLFNAGMRVAHLRGLHELVVWGLKTGVIQDPARTDIAKTQIEKGFEVYPTWLRVLSAITVHSKDADIAQEAGVARETLDYYKKTIQEKFLLGESPVALIRFAFQVIRPISPPTAFVGWKTEKLPGDTMAVLVYLAQGYSVKEIATFRHSSEKTISYHIGRLKRYFHIKGRGNVAYTKLLNIILQKRPDLLKDRPRNLSSREQFILTLPPQQKKVLELLIQGKDIYEIGRIMNLSKKTIEYHRSQLFGSLGATTVQDLVAIAHSYKHLFQPDEPTYKQQNLLEMAQITKKGKDVYANDQLLRNVPIQTVHGNIVFIREPRKGGFIPEGWSLVYFMDSEQSAHDMAHGEIPYLLIPTGTFNSGGSPILDVWKKRFQKPGHEHILGILEANVMPDVIFLDKLSVRPGYQRNTIAQKIIELVQQEYPKAEISHSSPTDKGRSFLKKNQLLEPRHQTPDHREDMNQLDEGFHDKSNLEAFYYVNPSGSFVFWFFRNGQPAGEIQGISSDGKMMGFGVQRSLQGTGIGRAMLKYAFEKTGLAQFHFWSGAHSFYHKIGGKRKGTDFTLDKDKFKSTPLSFKDIDKNTALRYLEKEMVDPYPSRN